VEKQKKSLDELVESQKQAAVCKAEKQKEVEANNCLLQKLGEEVQKKLKSKKDLERVNELLNWLDLFFMNLVNVIEKHVFVKVHQEFNQTFKEWFNTLMEDEAISVSLDEDFTPVVEQNGYHAELEGLSGGEKTSIALAYRLSLNKVINDLISTIKTKDLIILDEPTDGFSTEQLDKVRDVLEQLNTSQTIIVSHEPKMESFVQNIIRVEKHEHVSRAGLVTG
jgi:exonuclease SbcC